MNQLSITQDIGYLTLNNPPLNCLSPSVIDDIIAKLNQCEAEGTRAVVLRSALNGIFSAGVDPQALLDADLAGRKSVFLKLGDLINRFLSLRMPVIADVNGPAQAGGAVLVALADLALVDAQKGKICFSEVKVRLAVPRAIQSLVAAKVNPGKLTEVIALGKNIDAHEAVQVGLATQVYKSDEERQELLGTLLTKICRLDPSPLGQTLFDLREPSRIAMNSFGSEMSAFAKHLSDDYLGKGLREILSPKR